MDKSIENNTTELNFTSKGRKLKMIKAKLAAFHPDDLVTVTRMNHITEIKKVQNTPSDFPIVNLTKDQKYHYFMETGENFDYMLKKSGELLKYSEQIKNRAENSDSLMRTFKKLRALINTNFCGEDDEKFITLTYKKNMTDLNTLNNNLDYFIKKLKKKIGGFKYITVIEPQGRGAWHAHILLKADETNFIPFQTINDCWSNRGRTDIKLLDSIDNIGAYVVAYLTDLDVSDHGEEVTWHKERLGKKFIKGERLKLYPPKTQFYRPSQNIKQPTKEKMRYKGIKKEVGSLQPTYSSTVTIQNSDNLTINIITTEYYNSKRKKVNKIKLKNL